MSNETKEVALGIVSVIFTLSISSIFYVNYVENKKIVEAPPKPKPEIASNILGNPNTLESIFNVLKESRVSPEQFDGLFSMAGIKGLPNPPDGWKYIKTKEGIGLQKAEKLNDKLK